MSVTGAWWRRRAVRGASAGLVLGVLGGAGIFFVPAEPRALPVFLAASLKGALTGLLLAGTLNGREPWPRTLLAGALLGGMMGLVVALAKGFAAAPYVVHASLAEGLLLAAALKKWGRGQGEEGEKP